jgi:hypothetical protein
MPFPCHAVSLRVSFPFDLHNAAVFDSHKPCRAPAVLKATSQGHGTARHGRGMAWHDMCELASAVQRRHVGDLPAFGFFRLPRGAPRSLSEDTNPLNCRTSSSDISGYHAEFHEGHGTIGEWQGRGMACVNYRGTAWQGNGMDAAWHV